MCTGTCQGMQVISDRILELPIIINIPHIQFKGGWRGLGAKGLDGVGIRLPQSLGLTCPETEASLSLRVWALEFWGLGFYSM